MEERIIELEERYTHQQALLEELSGVLFAQQKTLDALKAEVEALKKRLEGFEPGLVEVDPDERPPHY
jgi:SlyX protein